MKLLKRKHKNAYVIFTREPEAGKTKTRLMPYYTPEQCAELHRCFLRDIEAEMKRGSFDIIVAYTGGEPEFLRSLFGRRAVYTEQRGSDLGRRMENAISDALNMGYERIVLTGSDIPELERETIESAFTMLGAADVVIGPTEDGGYYLIGMKDLHSEAFSPKLYGISTVYEETAASIRAAGLSVCELDTYNDIDTKEDLAGFRSRARTDKTLRRSHTGRFAAENLIISVIIPVYNEESTIVSMMDQLDRLKPANGVEVIFSDGGSSDDTLSLIGKRYRVISSETGRGRQMDEAAIQSSGDVLFFLHCDSILPQDFVNEIRRCMSRCDYGCFGVRFDSRNLLMLTNRIISNHRAFVRGLPFGDQGIFIDRGLFFETGMFPMIPVMEDYEYSLRLRRYGLRPCAAANRITTSSRRYGSNTFSIAATEFRMWNLRRLYRKGTDAESLAAMYRTVR